MNPYNFTLLLFAFGSFFVGLLVWFKRQDAIAKSYFVFSWLVTMWGIGHSISISQNVSDEVSLLATRIGQAGATFIPVRWLHFTLLITGNLTRYWKWLLIPYGLAVFTDAFMFTPFFIPRVAPTWEFVHFLRAGPVFHIYTTMYFTLVPLGFWILLRRMKVANRIEKVQLRGFFLATLAGFTGGGFGFLPAYDVMFPQYGYFLMPLYPFVMGYYMMRHRLLDIEQIAEAFQKEKLATIGLLAASVNHEIRNPLYAAKGLLDNYVEMTKEGLKNNDPLEIVERTRAQINRALDIITKLNRFAKPSEKSVAEISTGKQEANIQEAIQNVLDLVSYEFELDKIKINNQIQMNLPPIQADQRQLEEILFNLIVNACQAMKKGGGELTVSASLCHSEAKGYGHPRKFLSGIHTLDSRQKHAGMTKTVSITIQDTGTGIPPEQTKYLFEPFHTTKGQNGTGLGLYITKQLVERNNGRISVKSQDRKGTSFILEFKTK